jgi:hypothetical protein
MKQISLGGSFTFGDTSLTVNRMGYARSNWRVRKYADRRAIRTRRQSFARGRRGRRDHIDSRWRER